MDPTFFILLIGLAFFFGIISFLDKDQGWLWALLAGLLFIYITIALLSNDGGFTRIVGTTINSNETLDSANNTIIILTETNVYENVQDNNTDLMGWIFLLLGMLGIGGAYSAWKQYE